MLSKPEYNFTIETHEENRHLLDLFADGKEAHYLELGAIDCDIMESIVAGKKVCLTEPSANNARPVADMRIENEGLGAARVDASLSAEDRAVLPFIYFANLVNADHERTLLLTYGIVAYEDEGLPRFAPAILIPVRVFFEGGRPCLEARSLPLSNPLLDSLLKAREVPLPASREMKSVYEMDQHLSALELPEKGLAIRFENYLTFVYLRPGSQHVNRDRFLSAHRINDPAFDDELLFPLPLSTKAGRKPAKPKDVYYPVPFSRIQRRALASILEHHDVVITGYAQTGKSTVLLAGAINAIARDERVLYVSNSLPTLWNVERSMREIGLERFVMNLEPPVTEPKPSSNLTIKEDITSDRRGELAEVYRLAKEGERVLSRPIQGFEYLDILTQLALLNDTPHRNLPCSSLATALVRTDFSRRHDCIVLEPLLEIEEAFRHLHGFATNAWHVIPWENNVKDPLVITRMLSTYSNEFSILLKINDVLKDTHGFKPITSLQSFRASIRDFNALSVRDVPGSWRTDRHSLAGFAEAETLEGTFVELVHALEEARAEEEAQYDRLDEKVPSITNAIRALEGTAYQGLSLPARTVALDRLLSGREALRKSMVSALNAVKTLVPSGKKALVSTLGFTAEEADRLLEIFDVYASDGLAALFAEIVNARSLSAGVMLFQGLFNQKTGSATFASAVRARTQALLAASAPIDALEKEIAAYIKNFKETRRVFAGSDAQFLEALRSRRFSGFADESRKRLKELQESRDDFRELVSQAKGNQQKKSQAEALKKEFRANFNVEWSPSLSADITSFASFLVSFPDLALLAKTVFPAFRTARALEKEALVSLGAKVTTFVNGFTAIHDEYESFIALSLEPREASFKEKQAAMLVEDKYLAGVWKAQDAVWSTLRLAPESKQKNAMAEDFYRIQTMKRAMSDLEQKLRDPQFALRFGKLYDASAPEKTDLEALAAFLKNFRAYACLFSTPKDCLDSLDDAMHLELSQLMDRASVSTEGLMTSLKTYTHYFSREGLAVYLTDELAVAKDFADKLLAPQAQAELPYYLAVVRNLYALNNLSVDVHSPLSHALRPLVDEIAKSDSAEGLASDVSFAYFTALRARFERENAFSFDDYLKTLETMITLEHEVMNESRARVLESILSRRSTALPSEGLWLTPEIARVVRGSREMKRLVLASTDTLRYVPLDEFSVVIIDDAHRLNDIFYAQSLDQQQLIIAGDYLSFKAEVHSLINNFDASHEFQFSYRFTPTSRGLLLATQYLRLKNFGINRYGTQKDITYSTRRASFEEFVVSLFPSSALLRPVRTDEHGRRHVELHESDFKSWLTDLAERVFTGLSAVNLILSTRHEIQAARVSLEAFLADKTALAREKKAFWSRFLLTDESSLNERLELIAIAGAVQPTLSANKPLSVVRGSLDAFLSSLVARALEGERFNLLCEDVRYEKDLMERVYALLLAQKMSIAEARNFQLNRLIFTHLSISAVPADTNVLFCANYVGIVQKKRIGNLLTQLLFVSDNVLLYDGDPTQNEESSLETAAVDEFLGLLRFIKNRDPFPADEDIFDPLASLEGKSPERDLPYLPSAERSPYHELLAKIAAAFAQEGDRCYYASAPLDFLVVPEGSDVIYGVMILSPGFTAHSSLLNDYRDVFWKTGKKTMALRILRMDQAASGLTSAVKALHESMKEDDHDQLH